MHTTIILLVIVSGLFAAPSILPPTFDSEELLIPKGISTDAHLKKIADFWTVDKMKQAKTPQELYPELFTQQLNNTSLDSKTVTFQEQMEEIIDAVAPNVSESRTAFPGTRPTIGKVYWNVGNGQYGFCSASIIPSDSRDLIITAGHCIHDGKQYLINNQWVFVPGYINSKTNSAPYGIWAARRMSALPTWTQGRSFNADVGMVSLSLLNGQHIQDRMGTNGLIFNAKIPGYTPNLAGSPSYISSFGYPLNLQNGLVLQYCYTTPSRSPYAPNSYNGLFIRCDMGGGCSGGPWINNANQVISVNSFSITSFNYGNLNGPYLDQTIQSLYNSCKAA